MQNSRKKRYYSFNQEVVNKALAYLANTRSHEHFPGYLALIRGKRSSMNSCNSDTIVQFYKDFLFIIDAPENRPYLNPFRSRGIGNPITLYQPNVAGSYAPSSIRKNGPLSKIINIDVITKTGAYELVEEHWKIALSEMLSGNKLPLISTLIFLLRDYAFLLERPSINDLVPLFRTEFSISKVSENGDEIFNTIFEDDSSSYSDEDLFDVELNESADLVKFRKLKLSDLGSDDLVHSNAIKKEILANTDIVTEDASLLEKDDPVLRQVRRAIELGYAGVIISGPPGTGKSWYAQQIGVALSGSWRAVRTIQFHPSYQYEDFIFGYVAQKDGTFRLTEKEFVLSCRAAASEHDRIHVLIIDEISRTDIIRVFGEALTYLERDKRDQPFMTASGEELSVPSNLIVIGTMNPWDKGVDEIDIALERRFAQVDLYPSVEVLNKLLRQKSNSSFIDKIIEFYEKLNQNQFEEVRLGHAYFLECVDKDSAMNIWSFRIKPTLKKICRLNSSLFSEIEKNWYDIVLTESSETIENPLSDTESPRVG